MRVTVLITLAEAGDRDDREKVGVQEQSKSPRTDIAPASDKVQPVSSGRDLKPECSL